MALGAGKKKNRGYQPVRATDEYPERLCKLQPTREAISRLSTMSRLRSFPGSAPQKAAAGRQDVELRDYASRYRLSRDNLYDRRRSDLFLCHSVGGTANSLADIGGYGRPDRQLLDSRLRGLRAV